jgi:exodeoxyribonuclease-3
LGGHVRLLSWNVNGIRSALRNGLANLVDSGDFDALLFQEIRADVMPPELAGSGYVKTIYPSKRKGYSGLMALTKESPKRAIYGIGMEKFDSEARALALDMGRFYLVNAYFPNARHGLTRLDFKLEFDKRFARFLEGLREDKPVIACGDFNVAHADIDIARPRDNIGNAGFTMQERKWMTCFVGLGYTDTFRMFVKDRGHYTWWAYRANARERNIGWRIDYFFVSDELRQAVKGASILSSFKGSDHAPITLELS